MAPGTLLAGIFSLSAFLIFYEGVEIFQKSHLRYRDFYRSLMMRPSNGIEKFCLNSHHVFSSHGPLEFSCEIYIEWRTGNHHWVNICEDLGKKVYTPRYYKSGVRCFRRISGFPVKVWEFTDETYR